MIRTFLPMILPIVLVTAFAAGSFPFWKKGARGSAMTTLPAVVLGGETLVLSHPAGSLPMEEAFAWRISLSPESLARLGPLEVAYGEGQPPELPGTWVPMPAGTAFGAFRVNPPLPDDFSPERLRLWVRGRNPGATTPVSIEVGTVLKSIR